VQTPFNYDRFDYSSNRANTHAVEPRVERMAFKVWLIAGLGLSLVGGALVSVEAIKLENLRRLGAVLRDQVETALESPLIVWEDQPVPADYDEEVNRRRGFGGHSWLYIASHFLAGVLPLLLLDYLTRTIFHIQPVPDIIRRASQLHLYISIPIYAIGSLFILLLCTFSIGEFVLHKFIGGGVKAAYLLLQIVDRNTPSGAIGLIGLAFLILGTAAQIVGTLLS
jgi:hypothetical protein